MTPTLKSIDHIHVFVSNRAAATRWYREILGLNPVPELEFWANDGGPLTISDAGASVHFALFEAAPLQCRSTIALGVGAAEFMAWQQHLSAKLDKRLAAVDHQASWSLYFSDPDGNPYEITTYDHEAVERLLRDRA